MKTINKDTPLKDSGLSTRTRNLLYQLSTEFGVKTRFGEKGWDIKIGVLEGFPVSKLRGFKGFGKSSLRELEKTLKIANVNLEMEKTKEERYERTVIYFNRFTEEGRVLYELARLLEKQDPEIIIK